MLADNVIINGDPALLAFQQQDAARKFLIAKAKELDLVVAAMDLAHEELAVCEQRLLESKPISKEGAGALLAFVTTVIQQHAEIAELVLPALTNIQDLLREK